MEKLDEKILVRYLNKEASEEDVNYILSYIESSEENARHFFRIEELFALGKYELAGNDLILRKAEKRVTKKINDLHHDHLRIKRKERVYRYAAAIFLAVLTTVGSWYGYKELGTDKELFVEWFASETVEEIELPDGSKIWLNQASYLKYSTDFGNDNRYIYLEGEAYLMVKHDKVNPFIVESESLQVKVLGTTFNFKNSRHSDSAEVSLIEGEVEVKGNGGEGMIVLSPGQRAELDKVRGRLQVKQVDTDLDAVWHNDLIPFRKATVFYIIDVLERFYDVTIIPAPDLAISNTYSGVLRRKDSIESILRSLQNSIPIDFTIEGKTIYITSSQ